MSQQQVLRSFAVPSLGRHLESTREILAYWMERSRTRSQLRAAEDRVLLDVGITREQAIAESGKYFWQQ